MPGLLAAAGIMSCLYAYAQTSNVPPELYSAAQADQGAQIFARSCAACHGANLEGVAGPALMGPMFHQMAAAQNITAKLLLAVISQSMPEDNPGSLSPAQYAAVTAYILQKNGYPSGAEPLSQDSTRLESLSLGAGPGAADGTAAGGAMRLASTGVYSASQAARGKEAYGDNCVQCHGAELDGGDSAPELAGSDFLKKWGGLPVGALHAFIDKNMPPGNGGALGAVREADIVAYILQKNGFPSGASNLPADPGGLNAISLK